MGKGRVPGEWHEGSLLMLGVLLRRQGWPVAYLGQPVPLSDLGALTQVIHPPAIVLVAMIEETAQALSAWPRHLAQAAGNPLVGFGGKGLLGNPDLQRSIPGIYLGSTLQEGLSQLTGFLKTQSK